MNVSFENENAINLINEICSKLENIKYDETTQKYFFYGGVKIPLYSEDGEELETVNNHKIIEEYLPQIKKCFKGYTNWYNMWRCDKKCGNYLRLIINKIEHRKKYPFKVLRFPKYKSYFVKRYELPSYCINTPLAGC